MILVEGLLGRGMTAFGAAAERCSSEGRRGCTALYRCEISADSSAETSSASTPYYPCQYKKITRKCTDSSHTQIRPVLRVAALRGPGRGLLAREAVRPARGALGARKRPNSSILAPVLWVFPPGSIGREMSLGGAFPHTFQRSLLQSAQKRAA